MAVHDDDDVKGLLWRLPSLHSRDAGKLGPAIGLGFGCGIGVGVGLVGGAGFGLGLPGLQFGLGVGAGCGIGMGFGYGLGKGWAYDENGKYSNVGELVRRRKSGPYGGPAEEIGAVWDTFNSSLKRTFEMIERESDKWKRY